MIFKRSLSGSSGGDGIAGQGLGVDLVGAIEGQGRKGHGAVSIADPLVPVRSPGLSCLIFGAGIGNGYRDGIFEEEVVFQFETGEGNLGKTRHSQQISHIALLPGGIGHSRLDPGLFLIRFLLLQGQFNADVLRVGSLPIEEPGAEVLLIVEGKTGHRKFKNHPVPALDADLSPVRGQREDAGFHSIALFVTEFVPFPFGFFGFRRMQAGEKERRGEHQKYGSKPSGDPS